MYSSDRRDFGAIGGGDKPGRPIPLEIPARPISNGSPRSLGVIQLGRTPGLIYAAWGDQSKRRTYLDAAYYLSRREPADSAQIDSLSSYLDTPAQAYPDLLRNANASDSLPYNVFQNPAYALGLLSRNLDDPILVDLYVYERNLLLELALEPLFPRHGYIPGSAIRRILNETY